MLKLLLKISSLLIFGFTCSLAFTQDSSDVILTIDDAEIPVADYLYFLHHNDPDRTKSRKENSEDFIAYQLKLCEARQRGYDTTRTFLDELADYRDLLARPYLNFSRINDEDIEEYYRRYRKELEIRHIRIEIKGDPYRDTLPAYIKTDSIRKELLHGAGFAQMARLYSNASSASQGGYVGYITGMQVSFPLEELAFSTAPGEISHILRTSTAYHLVTVHQEKEPRGSVRISRIYKRGGPGFSDQHNQKIVSELDSLRLQILAGEEFNSLSRKYSDMQDEDFDPELPVIRSRGRNEKLVDAAFNLDEDGEISPVVITRQGYFLIKRLGFQPLQGFVQVKDQIREYYINNPSRQNYLRDKFLRNVMDHYGFNFDREAYEDFVKYGAYSFKEGSWIEPRDLDSERVIFTIGDFNVTYQHFSDYLGKQEFAYSFINYPPVVGKHFQDFFLATVLNYLHENLESRYPEVKVKMRNYSNALLIGRIENEIWEMASKDRKGLKKHFLDNKNKYEATGYEGLIIRFKDMESRQKLEFEINNSDMGIDELESWLVNEYGDLLSVERVVARPGENDIIDHFIWNRSQFKKEYSLIMVKGGLVKLPAHTLDEAISDVIIDYQKVYEHKMVKQWQKKYRVRLNKKLINEI